VTFFILRINERNVITMYIGIHVKYSSFLSDFNETQIFSTDFRRILISNIAKLHTVGTEFFHADRRTDMTRLVVAFRNFVNAPKNDGCLVLINYKHCLEA